MENKKPKLTVSGKPKKTINEAQTSKFQSKRSVVIGKPQNKFSKRGSSSRLNNQNFVSKVKTTVLKFKQKKFIEKWVDDLDNKLKKKIILNRFTKKALSLINYKGLGKSEIYRLKLVISGCSIFLKNLDQDLHLAMSLQRQHLQY